MIMKRMVNNTKIFSTIKRMKRFYCVICSKYRKLEKPKTSYLLEKTLVLSIICSNCKNEDEKITSNINKTEFE